MCPPTPNSNPRCTQSVRMYVPASHDTQKTAKLRFSSNSNSLDSYIVRIRSCRLTAEMRGGRWKRAPVSVWMARGRAVGFGRAEWMRRTATYSFPEERKECQDKFKSMSIERTCSLLRLHQTGGPVNADNQAASNFWIKGSAVTSFLHAQYPS